MDYRHSGRRSGPDRRVSAGSAYEGPERRHGERRATPDRRRRTATADRVVAALGQPSARWAALKRFAERIDGLESRLGLGRR